MPIRKKKISDLTLADSLKGLYTIGYKVVGGVKISVKVGLEYIQVAYEDVVKATQDAISAAKTALTAASTADTSREAIEANELERKSNESARKTSEQERAAAENQRATAEIGRDNAEKARVTEFSKIKTDAEKATGDAISATGKTNEATQNANVATNAANAATAAANQAAIEANKSAENAEGKAQAAQDAADNANDTAEHPTYIGQDHYVYKWNKTTSSYDKTDIYTKGDAFSIKKVYSSVAELEADADNTGIAEGDFVLVNTGDVENPDNAKLYVKTKSDAGVYSYEFLVDMSGAIGFTGKTPQFSMGTISTLEAGSSATATVSEDGVDSDGNPKYKINFAIPRGNPGAPFNPVGQYDTLELLQAAIPDGSGVNGMIAVGTEAPYEYYAWLNGGWVNQGKVAGGGSGNIVVIPSAVTGLTEQSSSAEIFNAFGSKDDFMDICKKLYNNDDAVCVIRENEEGYSVIYSTAAYTVSYTDDNNASIQFYINAANQSYVYVIAVNDGLATVVFTPFSMLTDAPSDGNTYGRKNQDWVEVPEKSDVLTKTNATKYTPTGDYQPATKKYVDNISYGKVINGSPEILNNCNLTGAEAEAKIATLFGSLDAFKNCVQDMADNHTRYYYVWDNNNVDVGGIVWVSTDRNNYELHFTFNYPNLTHFSNIRVVLRYTIRSSTPSTVVIQEISTDDKLKTMFADITADMYQNINNISGYGISSIQNDADATTERNYPIKESGTLFYGKGPYGSVNGIFGSYLSNRWFARGGGRGSSQMTSWKELLFKEDMATLLPVNSNLNDFKKFGVYRQSDTVGLTTVLNRPPGSTGEAVLQVYECGPNYVVQTYYNITDEKMFVRFYHVGTWGSWRSIVTGEGNVFNLEGFDFNTATQAKKEEFIKWVKGYNQIARIVHDSAEVVDDLYIPISSYKIGDYGNGEIIYLDFIAIGARKFEIYATITISVNNPDTGYVDINSIVNIKINRYNISPDFIRKYIVISDTPTL